MVNSESEVRLQKYIASCGVASRRAAEELIKEGRVKVNGAVIRELGFKLSGGESVKVNNKVIKPSNKIYIVLNKPAGCVSTVSDEKSRKTVIDVLKNRVKGRIYPVGRLDFNTTGCLILTNDGEFANSILHPKFEVEKKYIAKIKGKVSDSALNKLRKTIKIDNKKVKAKEVGVHSPGKNDVIYIVITQGINHQVKKMVSAAGLSIMWLKRLSVGKITVNNLPEGKWRYLTEKEVGFFK